MAICNIGIHDYKCFMRTSRYFNYFLVQCVTIETQPKAVEVKATQLNCKVTSHATSMGTHNGTTISWSYYVKASTSDFSSFTCITSFALDDAKTNGTQIKGSATDIPSATCETPVIKVLCKYFNRDVNIWKAYSFLFVELCFLGI